MKYRKQSGRDRAFVQVNGKRVYLPGKYNSAESLKAYSDMLRKHTEEKPVIVSIPQLIVAYLDHCLVYYKDGSNGQYRCVRSVMRKLLETHRDCEVKHFGPKALKSFRSHLVKGEVSRGYVNKSISIVKLMFKWAVAEEHIEPSVYHALTAVNNLRKGEARETSKVKSVPWKDVRLVIRAAKPMLADMMRLQWLIGCRPGEVCCMHKDDIDQTTWQWQPRTHKNEWRGKSLSYYLGPLSQAIVKRWIDDTVEGYLFSPRKVRKRSNLTWSRVSYRQAVVRACYKAGVSPFAPHRIRHSRATSLRKRHGIEASRIALGLASLETAAIYAEQAEKQAKRIAERF